MMDDKIQNAIELIKSSALFELAKKIERKKGQVIEFTDVQIKNKTIIELMKETWDAAIVECYNTVMADLSEVEKPKIEGNTQRII